MAPPDAVAEGRVNIAFGEDTLDPTPTWTRLDDTDNLVASYAIDRGRLAETDTTDGGRATVRINDRDGVIDPTNPFGPYFGLVEPLLQITLGRWNPVLEEWQTRFRGFVDSFKYEFDPSQQVNRATLELVDIFEILNTIQMLPDGTFGDSPPPASEGNIFFDNATMGDRITQVMGNAGIDPAFYVAFSGNVELWETVYSSGESPLAVIQEAVDAEFPGAANAYPDRFGRLATHGRLARFDPATIAAGAGDTAWDWHHWHCGDGAAVLLAPSITAQIREFAFNRGLAQVVTQASATPRWNASGLPLTGAEKAAQVVNEPGAPPFPRGIRSWSKDNLLTKTGLLDSSDSLAETKKFAQWQIDTHSIQRNRVERLVFKSIRPGAPGAAATWKVLCESDISDFIGIAIASPGGGGFNDEDFVIEATHETNEPLNPDYDMVTMALDVSNTGYNTDPEGRFPTP